MGRLTEKKVIQLYNVYKKKAIGRAKHNRYDSSLYYLKATAFIGYSFYLGFKDEELEDLLELLSNKIVKKNSFDELKDNTCVFYDSLSVDNGGLVQQYLNAIMSQGYRIKYIAENSVVLKESSAIGKMLRDYGKAEIIIIPHGLKPFEEAQFIYNQIIESCSSRLFIQTKPYSATACCAFYALPNSIKKYKVDLTDHTFWIGTRFIDYSFEFRPFGCVASMVKRGINADCLFYLPFYPIIQHNSFQGFPKEANGKIVLFSGGFYYKIYDVNDTFFVLAKSILDACPNMVLLFAGSGDVNVLYEKIHKHQLSGRFIPIGQRSDITECFENCDIYLNTYPFGGGLMSQYAAQLGKPIVNYQTPHTAKVEEFICQVDQMEISDNSIIDVVERVKRLANDEDLRHSYGNRIQGCVVTPTLFNQMFSICMNENKNPLPYSEDISFDEHLMDIKDKLEYENNNKTFVRSFTKMIGLPIVWQKPVFLWESLISIIRSKRLNSVLKTNLRQKSY